MDYCMNSKKELKVVYPPITSSMAHAPIFSIISDTEEYIPWFLLNYIQISVQHECFGGYVDFHNFMVYDYVCPFIEYSVINDQFIKNNDIDKIFNILIDCIDKDYYILLQVDMFFVSVSRSYGKEHRTHHMFIYGYDKLNEVFLVADFFKDGKYSFEKEPFSNILMGYLNNNNGGTWLEGFRLFKKKSYQYHVSISDFKNVLERYLYGKEPSAIYHSMNNYFLGFGLHLLYNRVYEEAKRFIEFNRFDIRILANFCDHKKILHMTVEYLIKIGQNQLEPLLSDFEELYKNCLIFRNKAIKYNILGYNSKFDIHILDDFKLKEIKALEGLIEKLVI